MKKEYNVCDHAEHIFETDLAGFFNWIAVEGKAKELLFDFFFEENQEKNLSLVGALVRRNKWQRYIYQALDMQYAHVWLALEDYAQMLHDTAEEEFAIAQFEQGE